MKKILLASAITIASATSSMAAAKHGFYVGLGLAGLSGHHSSTITYQEPGVPVETNKFGFSRFAPGADIMIGYMALINTFMIGAEFDYLFGNLNRTNTIDRSPNLVRTSKVDSTGGAWGLAVRLGFNCLDRFMPYIRLGIENRRFKLTHASQNLGLPDFTEISSAARKTAFAPGIGMDFKVSKNLILGLEYRYAMYGSITKSGTNPGVPVDVTFKVSPRVSTGLVNLKYVFGH
jgi:opacity protein-like surface antigen